MTFWRFVICTSFICLVCNISNAQSEITILRNQLSENTSESNHCTIALKLGVQYITINQDSALYFLSKAQEIAHRTNNKKIETEALIKQCHVYVYYFHDETKALSLLKEGLLLATKENDNLGLAKCYQYLGVISIDQNIGNVEELLSKASHYALLSKDWEVTSEIYNVGNSYYNRIKNYSKALEYARKSMAVCENHDFKRWFSYALDCCDALESLGKHREVVRLCNIIDVKLKAINKDDEDFVFQNDLARFETKKKDFKKAEALYLKIIETELAKSKPDTFHLYHVYRQLLPNYLSLENYKKAYQAQNELSVLELFLKDKKQVETSRVQMTKMQAAFDVQKKEQEIALLAKQKKDQLFYLISAVLVSILLAALVFVIYRNRSNIEQKNVQLSQLNTTKDKLFAILSHDLRSPVASLQNYLMLIDWGMLSQEEFTTSAVQLESQVKNVHNMLENVLNWSISQMEGMEPKFKEVELKHVIDEQIELLKFAAQQKNITILNHINAESMVLADQNHLGVVFRNLLHNAIKFSYTNSEVMIDKDFTVGYHKINVRDNGVGMSQSTIDKLFKINTSHSSLGTANEQGIGLGLVLVKNLVELNKGSLQVISAPQKGSTFSVLFKSN